MTKIPLPSKKLKESGSIQKKKFSFDTIKDFDEHIERSIEGYDVLERLIIPLASNFITPDSTVLDYGCSSGRMLNELAIRHEDSHFLGADITDHNFLPENELCKNVKLLKTDITDLYFYSLFCGRPTLGLMIFTLQFLSREKRLEVLTKAYEQLEEGGALIVAEKVYCESPKMQDYFQFAHYDRKRLSFSPEEILNKQRDLRQIMKPLYQHELYCLFNDAGFDFTNVEPIWASYNFRAFCLIK